MVCGDGSNVTFTDVTVANNSGDGLGVEYGDGSNVTFTDVTVNNSGDGLGVKCGDGSNCLLYTSPSPRDQA